MRQTTQITNACTADKKTKFAELNHELRELKTQERLSDYEWAKGVIDGMEWNKTKQQIKARFQKVMEERNAILNGI